MKNIDLGKREALKSPFFYTYLITDPEYYGDDVKSFEKTLCNILENFSVHMVCFRDKHTKDIKPLAKKCLEISKKYKINKVLLNGEIDLAQTLGFDGVHLTSTQFEQVSYARTLSLYTLVSTHSENEIEYIKEKGAQGVTYSPIFYKENKGEPKGCELLDKMVSKYQSDFFDIYALGGITSVEQLNLVKNTHCRGFASISYFF